MAKQRTTRRPATKRRPRNQAAPADGAAAASPAVVVTKASAKNFTVTRAELARLIDCVPDRITKYVAEGLPTEEVGGGRGKTSKFDLRKVLPWLLSRRALEEEAERRRADRLRGDKLEQEIRIRAGELVEVAATELRWAALVSAFRERLLSLPATALQRGIVDDAGEEALIALVDEALSELAQPVAGDA